MANAYTGFCVEIPILTEVELQFAKKLIKLLDAWFYDDLIDESREELTRLCDIDVLDSGGECRFDITALRQPPYLLYVFAEESGDLDTATTFIQTFLRECRRKDIIELRWADWCSKPRPNEFGGGVVLISATDVRYLDPHAWVRATSEEMQAAASAAPPTEDE